MKQERVLRRNFLPLKNLDESMPHKESRYFTINDTDSIYGTL